MKLQRNNLIWLHKGFGTIVRKFSNLSFLVWIFLFFLLLVEIVNRQIAIFADFQYCISADIVDGFEKIQRRTGISFSKARNIRRTCYVQKLFWMSKKTKKNTTIYVHIMFSWCSELSFFMNNLSSYCGLVDAKIRASDIHLSVINGWFHWTLLIKSILDEKVIFFYHYYCLN